MRLHERMSFGIAPLAILATGLAPACDPSPNVPVTSRTVVTTQVGADDRIDERRRMVEQQLRARGLADERVLGAMASVPRHRFIPEDAAAAAYGDHPLPIGLRQTISQPYIVGYMTEAVQLAPDDRVLEIGTGSGYQSAVLSELVAEVYSIEIIPELAERARATLAELKYDNVRVRTGNGYLGWPEHAPFDAILVTAAPDEIPAALVQQLAVGARMAIPVGDAYQEMVIVTKTGEGVVEEATFPVRFVPMTGKPGGAGF